ncbi:MAG TPA: PEP-CTERM sorting domain-containing protein [Bryobacteraceae bacterium]|nr:PEP-CTERM sorting domain-containing protein [Bryobacteraceae bacterium]
MMEFRLIQTPKLLCFGIMIAMASIGHADTILSVDNSASTPHYQQTKDDPCIFGGSDCKGAVGFPTQTSTAVGGGVSTVGSVASPLLFDVTAGAIRGLANNTFGNAFMIGVDINQAGNPPGSNLNMLMFEVWDNTTNTELAHLPVPTQLSLFANGTGFTDALFQSVSIAGLSASDIIRFKLAYDNASDGTDSFFLVSTVVPPPQVPEPLTMGLTGAGLVGIYFLRGRRPSSL